MNKTHNRGRTAAASEAKLPNPKLCRAFEGLEYRMLLAGQTDAAPAPDLSSFVGPLTLGQLATYTTSLGGSSDGTSTSGSSDSGGSAATKTGTTGSSTGSGSTLGGSSGSSTSGSSTAGTTGTKSTSPGTKTTSGGGSTTTPPGSKTSGTSGAAAAKSSAPALGINASLYGVSANTGTDQTAAIQRMINSLPLSDGVPAGNAPVGGTIVLPAGNIIISGPLLVRSGIWLLGSPGGTTIYDTSTDPNAPAIELNSPYSHDENIGASIQNLTIYTAAGPGISTAGATTSQVIDLDLENVTISSGGVGVDLSAVKVYHGDFQNVTITNNGGTAINLANSIDTSFDDLVVDGTARAGFQPANAMVKVIGQNYFRGGSISGSYPNAMSLDVEGTATFTGFDLSSSLGGNTNTVAVRVANTHSVFFDTLSGIATNRQLQLVSAQDVEIGQLNVAGNFNSLADVSTVDSASHLTVNEVNGARPGVMPAGGRIIYNNVDASGYSAVNPNTYIVPTNVFNASSYGANAGGVVDDTMPIQAAIQAAANAGGGIVYLSQGVFKITSALKLPSNVTLAGDGDGTVLNSVNLNGATAAINLVGVSGHAYNINSAIQDMMIHTAGAEGVTIDPSVTDKVDHLQISNVIFSTGGVAIDLRRVPTINSDFNRIIVSSPGSSALLLGSATEEGHGNYVQMLRLIGTDRSNFNTTNPMIALYGGVAVQNGAIEGGGSPVLPLYISGNVTLNGLYLEYQANSLATGVEVEIQNSPHVSIDQVNLLLANRQLEVLNSPDVEIGQVDISGDFGNLGTKVTADSTSHVTIDTVFAQNDSGELDNPAYTIGGQVSIKNGSYIPNIAPNPALNLLADPTFSTFSNAPGAVGPWTMTWGDALGAVTGTANVIQTANGPTLQITILTNPNQRAVAIFGNMNVTPAQQGQNAFVRMRVDAPAAAQVRAWSTRFGAAAATNVTDSLTTFMYSAPLAANGQFVISLPSAVPGATYDISELGVYAVQ